MNDILAYDESHIGQLKGLEIIRKVPGMYIGDLSNYKSQFQIVKEIIDNSIDEVVVNNRKHHQINITFLQGKAGYQVVVSDTGRGVPLGKIKELFSELHASGKWKGAYVVSGGIHGVGSKGTSALSKHFCAISKREEGSAIVNIQDCQVIYNKIDKPIDEDKSTNGTTVFFQPDKLVFHDVNGFIKSNGFKLIIDLISLLSVFIKNCTITIYLDNDWIDYTSFPKSIAKSWKLLKSYHKGKIIFQSDHNLKPIDFLKNRFNINSSIAWSISDIHKPISQKNKKDLIGYDIVLAITKDLSNIKGLVYTSTVNNIPIQDNNSHHITGLLYSLKHKLSQYISDSNVESYFKQSYRLPIYAAIMAQCKGAEFINQTKDEFKNEIFYKQYTESLIKLFDTYSDKIWQDLYEIIIDDLILKYKQYTNKSIKSSKGLKDIRNRLTNEKSYIPCRSKDNKVTELFIAEGDSASGTIGTGRNKEYQAVYKLKGKFINMVRGNTSTNGNIVFNDLVKVLGVGPEDTNLDSINFNKIFILTDADAHGYHIAVLIIGNLYKINPLILSEGRVYVATPPLYILSVKNKSFFLRDNNALMDFKVSMLYSRAFELHLKFINNKEIKLEGDHFRNFCYIIERIGNIIETCGNSLDIAPYILEQLVHCVGYLDVFNPNLDAIKSILGLDNVIHHKQSNSLILGHKGIEINVSLTNLKEEIESYVLPELELACWNTYDVLLTTKFTNLYNKTPMTFISLYNLFKTIDERNASTRFFKVTHLKGLGEMSPEELAYTCLDPISRSSIRITEIGNIDTIYGMLDKDTTSRKELLLSEKYRNPY